MTYLEGFVLAIPKANKEKFIAHANLADGVFVEYGEIRIHGRDERVLIKSFFDGSDFLYRLVKAFAE